MVTGLRKRLPRRRRRFEVIIVLVVIIEDVVVVVVEVLKVGGLEVVVRRHVLKVSQSKVWGEVLSF